MSDLKTKHCQACEGFTEPMSREDAERGLGQLDSHWGIDEAGRSIQRSFKFKNFHETMAFVNAVAWIAHVEDHHPDLAVGYNRCSVQFSTHAVGGLTENDFICAARIDALFD
ncbi:MULTISPECIES: 4a-hydroxytetrahydrobiopterin dehydratase [unclassified Thioalkalivibrio]|uniref:4a-hydroxytetrahydrobiopterin dehydratase n=1 Tax=unclassified Thioalkalivibrio TaxID=2621013 RepID=UPI0003677D62|nr:MULTISPECIES: 4a-hydroxytetrahydrobiopterin dehydratase [unclassified Thioalkalivibrio]